MRKIIIGIIAIAVALSPGDAMARKKNKKTDKHEVKLEQELETKDLEHEVKIYNPSKQLYGEWTLTSLRKKTVHTQERPYIYLDFDNYHFYGNNGCNAMNGRFTLSGGGVIAFKDVIATTDECHNVTRDKDVMKAFADVQRYHVTQQHGIEYLHLTNAKGSPIIVLKRQNLDFLNGAWVVKEVAGRSILDLNVRLVIDAVMQTLHGNTGCNIINGIIHIDPDKDFAIQFEDIHSSGNDCENIDVETALLIALEQTETCKRVDDTEMQLLNGRGETVIVISRINLR